MSLPVFKIGSNYYNVTQIIGKSLYANKTVTRYDYNGITTTPVTINKGLYVGTIYSWATSNGQLFLTLEGTYPYQNTVAYDSTAFSSTALEAQGSQTVQEEEEAKSEAEKTAFDRFLDSLGLTNLSKTIKWAIPVALVGYLGIRLYGEINKANAKKLTTHEE